MLYYQLYFDILSICRNRILAGDYRAATVDKKARTPFSIFQNPAKDQALAALPPVAALDYTAMPHRVEKGTSRDIV